MVSTLDEIVVVPDGTSEPDHLLWICVQVVWKVDTIAAMLVVAPISMFASAISSCPKDADKVVACNSPVSVHPVVFVIFCVIVDVSVGHEPPLFSCWLWW